MKYFLDTEFIEAGPPYPLILLSIGIVSEDGRAFYAVNSEADGTKANDWVKTNVLPHLSRPDGKHTYVAPIETIREEILKFCHDAVPEFWGYYADYDWVVFCQIFGAMVDLPKGWPMYCRDIKQWCDELGNPTLPKQDTTEHNALSDALWNQKAYEFCREVSMRHGLTAFGI
jgi:hypothetical protein